MLIYCLSQVLVDFNVDLLAITCFTVGFNVDFVPITGPRAVYSSVVSVS